MASPHTALAVASDFVVGAFLYLRFGWDNNAALTGWQWYQSAALLGAISLAGRRRSAPHGGFA